MIVLCSASLASLAILVVSGRQWAYIPLFVCGLAALSYGQNMRSEVVETLSEKALYHHDMRLPPDLRDTTSTPVLNAGLLGSNRGSAQTGRHDSD